MPELMYALHRHLSTEMLACAGLTYIPHDWVGIACSGYWARAAVLLLSSGPAQGSSGLLLRPTKASESRAHQPRTGRVLIFPDGSTTFSEWSTGDEEDSSDEESCSDPATLEEAYVSCSNMQTQWLGTPKVTICVLCPLPKNQEACQILSACLRHILGDRMGD